MGPIRSGKSTLLHLLAGSDRPTAGHVIVDGVDLSRVDETERASLRGSIVGIVFQSQNLVPSSTWRKTRSLPRTLAIDRGPVQGAGDAPTVRTWGASAPSAGPAVGGSSSARR